MQEKASKNLQKISAFYSPSPEYPESLSGPSGLVRLCCVAKILFTQLRGDSFVGADIN
jgi:hypothetical protein